MQIAHKKPLFFLSCRGGTQIQAKKTRTFHVRTGFGRKGFCFFIHFGPHIMAQLLFERHGQDQSDNATSGNDNRGWLLVGRFGWICAHDGSVGVLGNLWQAGWMDSVQAGPSQKGAERVLVLGTGRLQ